MDLNKQFIKNIPDLIKEWDWERNSEIGLNPATLTHGSTKKAFWICNKGHKYEARIDHRCIMKSGCPFCARKRPIENENDLATLYPSLKAEWDYEKNKKTPQEYLPNSNQKVWWICSQCKHEWSASICSRVSKHTGCPKCAETQRKNTRIKTLISTKGSILNNHPDLCLDWDTEKNLPLTPDNVTAGSNKIVFWKCNTCGYSYKQSVANHTSGNSCPICKNKTIINGYNDFATIFPEIAEEWHPTKNGNLSKSQISPHSSKKVWWLCPKCNNDYFTSVYSRTSLKTGCPICANRIVISGQNDLSTTHPEIAQEWHKTKNGNLLPTDVVSGSNQTIWWMCPSGHSYKMKVVERVQGRNCPICAIKTRPVSRNKTIIAKKGSLSENYPDLSKQWDYSKNANMTPHTITAGSRKKAWWICQKGHSWEASINSRVRGNGCPTCAAEMFTSFPEQAIFFYMSKVTYALNRYKIHNKEIDVFLPNLATGIEYNGKYYHNNKKEKDDKKQQFFNDKRIRIIRVEEADYNLTNNDIISFVCDNNYENLNGVITSIFQILSLPIPDINIQRDRMLIYENMLLNEKENSLANKYPWLVEEWHTTLNGNLTPWQISYGSKKRVWWKCKTCGYEWESVAHTRKKAGCPRCAGRIATPGINDLESQNPTLAKEWDYEKNDILPSQVTQHSHKYVWWKCPLGHSWNAMIKSRNRGSKCPICNNKHKKHNLTN
ncbi:MAG: zinc-ribbon domain-containing protein [Clostridia bacterium]|nr:zinc-ribbon domain-containing protein [Clostridia bacterium]